MKEQTISEPDPCIRVGLTYNLKRQNHTGTVDEEAEYDNIETVIAIKNAIEKLHYQVEMLEADENLPQKLKSANVDIVFNIAEGRGGRSREAQVPALLSLMGIKFSGSDETTLCIALDKALTKRILSTYHIRTPKFRVYADTRKLTGLKDFRYPVIVKPNAEGSSKGIPDTCIAENDADLEKLIAHNINTYKQPVLAEEYIDGREFTVGLLCMGEQIVVFRPMEIIYLDPNRHYSIYSFNVKQNYKKLIRYECPANIDKKTEACMINTARKIFEALECKDFARIDFRLAQDGRLYFIEINPLPGLAPGYSDYPMLAEFNGLSYDALIQAILQSALNRYDMRKG